MKTGTDGAILTLLPTSYIYQTNWQWLLSVGMFKLGRKNSMCNNDNYYIIYYDLS